MQKSHLDFVKKHYDIGTFRYCGMTAGEAVKEFLADIDFDSKNSQKTNADEVTAIIVLIENYREALERVASGNHDTHELKAIAFDALAKGAPYGE